MPEPTSLPEEVSADAARRRVARSLVSIALMATILAILPALYGAQIPVANVARLFVSILACVLVFQGKLWARWVLVFFVGLVGAFAVTQVFNPSLDWGWRLVFGGLGARILWEVHFLFTSPVAKAYYQRVTQPGQAHGGV